MAEEDTPLDQEAFDRRPGRASSPTGTDRRVAEGRARSAAVRAYRAAQPRGGREARGRRDGGGRRRGGRQTAQAPRRCRRRRPLPLPQPPPPRRRRAVVAAAPVDAPRARSARCRPATCPTPKKGADGQAPAAGAGAARGHPAGRARAGRPRERVAAPADRGVRRDVHPARRPGDLLDVRERAAARAGEPEPHAEPVEGAVVLPRPAGAAALLPPDGGGHRDPRRSSWSGSRPCPSSTGTRAPSRATARSRSPCSRCCSCSAPTLTIIGSFFRGPGYNWVWPWAQGVFFEL